MGTERIRVLVADDHLIIHTAARYVVESAPDIDVIETVTTWTAAVDAYPALRPDVVLLDVNIPPDNGGLDGAKAILALDASARIVAYSAGGNVRLVDAALQAGCLGFLSKNSPPAELAPVLRMAAAGSEAMDSATMQAYLRWLRGRVDHRRETALTEREIEILQLMAEGHNNVVIAEKLHAGYSTVKNQITALFNKLGVTDRTAAAIIAVRKGIID